MDCAWFHSFLLVNRSEWDGGVLKESKWRLEATENSGISQQTNPIKDQQWRAWSQQSRGPAMGSTPLEERETRERERESMKLSG